jgi:hypothetical protein
VAGEVEDLLVAYFADGGSGVDVVGCENTLRDIGPYAEEGFESFLGMWSGIWAVSE